jgi:hypothetical protein
MTKLIEPQDPADQPAMGGRAPGHLVLGAAGELLFASRLALFGYQVYRPLADDRGVDLVVDVGRGRHAMVQVKSVHAGSYIFMKKSTFALEPWVTVGLVVFDQNHEVPPSMYLIPATAWAKPLSPLVERDYEGKKSLPEYGLGVNKNWMHELAGWSATQVHVEAVLNAARHAL